jgi:argininosuccinate lyase
MQGILTMKPITKTNRTWGGRFKKPLDPKVAQFQASIHFDQRLYRHDIQLSKAHAAMLCQQKLISVKDCESICQGLDEIQNEIENGVLIFDHMLEDIHMNIEHMLEQKIGKAAKMLHTGRSRNDQVATDLRMYLREQITRLGSKLAYFIMVLSALAKDHAETVMPGYTHLQKAQPVTLKHHIEAYSAMLQRDQERFHACCNRLNFCPLGAGALAGSQLPLDRNFVAKQLAFDGIIENTLDAVSDRDFVIEFCAAASILSMHLSRLSEDIILWATEEFGFVTLDDAFATGSSLMPNKKNPDVVELIRGKSGRIYGHLMALLTMMKALPLTYNKDLQEDKEALFDTVDTLHACLDVLPGFMQSLTFNTNRMLLSVKESYMDATTWVEKLVLQGVPFRDAHEIVGQWVQEAMDKKIKIRTLLLEKKHGHPIFCSHQPKNDENTEESGNT